MMSFIDDIGNITRCGINSIENNIFITQQIQMKRLKFNVGSHNKKNKCQKLHIGKDNTKCTILYVRDKPIDHVNEIVYIGDIVHGSGSNMSNIRNRVLKGKGITNQIFNILENVCFGSHYFEIALLLRRTMLISSVLYNSCVWQNLNSQEIFELNKLDKLFFSRLCKVSQTATFISFSLSLERWR